MGHTPGGADTPVEQSSSMESQTLASSTPGASTPQASKGEPVLGMCWGLLKFQPKDMLLPALLKLADDSTGAAALTWTERMELALNIVTADSQVKQFGFVVQQLHTTFHKQHTGDTIWTMVQQLKEFAELVDHCPLMIVVAKLLERDILEDLTEFKHEKLIQWDESCLQFYKALNEGKVGPELGEEVKHFGHAQAKPYTMLRALAHLRVASGSKIRRDAFQDPETLARALEKQVVAQITYDDIAKQDWYKSNPILMCLQQALQATCLTSDWDALEFMMDRLLSFHGSNSQDLFHWTALPVHVLGPYMVKFEPSKKTSINKKGDFVVRCEKGKHTILRFVSQMGSAHTRMQVEVDGITKMLKYVLFAAASALWGHLFTHAGSNHNCAHTKAADSLFGNSSFV